MAKIIFTFEDTPNGTLIKLCRSGMVFMPDINMRLMSGNEKTLPDIPCYNC